MNFFDCDKRPLKIDKPIRLIELFAGIGSQAKALQKLNADFTHHKICEFDRYAVQSYNAIHGTNFETSDITQITAKDLEIVDTDKYCYILTYSFPCQDLSQAGLKKGMAKGGGTRSGLLWEVERLLNECEELPQVLLMENVTQVHGTKNKAHFDEWVAYLESKGYKNYWKDLNSKNFGVPQNRNRCFMVSVLGDYTYEFPKEFPLELRLKDLLEDNVDEKFYLKKVLNAELKDNYIQYDNSGKGYNSQAMRAYYQDGLAPTLPARNHGDKSQVILKDKSEIIKIDVPQIVRVRKYPVDVDLLCECLREHKTASKFSNKEIAERLNLPLTKVEHWFRQDDSFSIPDAEVWFKLKELLGIETNQFDEAITVFEEKEGVFEKANRCYFAEGIAPTLTSTSANEKIIEPLTKEGYRSTDHFKEYTNFYVTPRGSDGQLINGSYNRVWKAEKYSGCINLTKQQEVGEKDQEQKLHIRKLTPKECWRLMGFEDTDFEKAEQCNSNSKLYQQAGNSIVVDVLYYIFKEMLDPDATTPSWKLYGKTTQDGTPTPDNPIPLESLEVEEWIL